MREKVIETYLVKQVKKQNGLCLKFISPSLDGVPDRLILMPHGKAAFAELKAPNKKMRPLQVRRKRQLEALGFKVYCIDSLEMIGGILSEIQTP
ncbi:MAG: VRR-NUC domain-containing protein [Firmicutes bacterium]|nr:VRR-NUC domain-containing protein [Bacillota bacterium]